MRRSIVHLQEVAQRWRCSAAMLLGACLALAQSRWAQSERALRLHLASQLAALQSLWAMARHALNDLLSSLASTNRLPRDAQRPWLTPPMPLQPPHIPAWPTTPTAPTAPTGPATPTAASQAPQLEDHRFRHQLERRVLMTTPDFTASVMARLSTNMPAPVPAPVPEPAPPTSIPSAPLGATRRTTQRIDPASLPRLLRAMFHMSHMSQAPQRALRWRTLLTQISVVGCIYAISAGIMLGTSVAIALIEPNVVLVAFVSWINSLVRLMAWLGRLTHMLLGSIGLLGIAYLLMLALLASLAVVVVGAPRLVTTLWREA